MRVSFTAAGLALACFTGCGAIEGLGNYQFDLVEDCGNGIDDDNDGDIDCADSDCAAQGYSCTAGAPDGWNGPIAVFEDSGGDGVAPGCPASYPHLDFMGGSSPEGAPATCEPCICQPPQPTCVATPFEAFSSKNCKGSMSTFDTPDGVCVVLGSPTSLRPGAAAQGSLACSVMGGKATVPPITWTSIAVACSSSSLGGGCETGVCTRRPEAPFGTQLCIWRSGDETCPSTYPHKRTPVEVTDDRGCSMCDCATTNAPTCTVTTTLYSDSGCQTPLVDNPAPGVCASYLPVQSVIVNAVSSGSASCSASGGNPTGDVHKSETTFCCAN
jgi:hypothetical protein